MIFNKKAGIKHIILFVLCLLSIVFVLLKQHDYRYLIDGKFSGFAFFYELYAGRDFILYELILLLVIPLVSHLTSCIYKGKFDRLIITRIGYANYFKKRLKQSDKDIWYYPIIINIVFVLFIHFLFFPVIGSDIYDTTHIYTGIGWTDFILFTLLQTIGWILLNRLCFLLSQTISNKYGYLLSLALCTIGSTILFTIIGSFIPFDLGWLFYILSPFTLLCPGVIGLWSLQSGWIAFLVVLINFIFYFILINRLKNIIIKGREQNG